MPEVSVILATHNRAAFLQDCLASLCAQTVPPESFEVCVIANACTDNTVDVVRAFADSHRTHNIFVVEEAEPGVSRARNCGIRATTAPLLANIDDDTRAVPDWLESYLTRFKSLPGSVALIAGDVTPIWQTPPPDWLTPWMKGILSATTNLGTEPRYLKDNEGLLECNSFYRRDVMTELGLYPVGLGRIGNSLLSGEGAIHALMQQRGWKLYFEPKALLHHIIHADRVTPSWLRRRFFWQGISDYATYSYYAKRGIGGPPEIQIELPLQPEDWAFVERDSPDHLAKSMLHFESLGFVLALSGLMPIEDL